MSDFLTEIEEAITEHLLVSGNLTPSRKTTPWEGFEWESTGYSARLETYACSCGAVTENLIGVFHVETRKRKDGGLDVRELSMPRTRPFSVSGEHAVSVTYLPSVQFCAACLPIKGFTNYRN